VWHVDNYILAAELHEITQVELLDPVGIVVNNLLAAERTFGGQFTIFDVKVTLQQGDVYHAFMWH